VISTVNCSAHVTRAIAHAFGPQELAAYPNVDGVLAFAHHGGCSLRIGGRDYLQLQRTLAGIARHPNVGAYVLVGLGCEVNQIDALAGNQDLWARPAAPGSPQRPLGLVIQERGGVRRTIQDGIAAVRELLPAVNGVQRTPQPISEWAVALHCGGSDGWSGVTANPVVGWFSDQVVRQGGTAILGETTEVYGAEPVLLSRTTRRQVGEKLLSQVRWWQEYVQRVGMEIDNNPTPGNKAGGLTTIYEKSLGSVAKGGSTPLTAVYDYAEPVTARGLVFMDCPGNDWTGATGQIAGGANLLIFTTGRGSCFGSVPTPTIKVCSNSATYARMPDDMDLNAGRVLEGERVEDLGQELLDLAVAVASGQPSKSEAEGIGETEFSPWMTGGPL
jgi:altronate hydrolase